MVRNLTARNMADRVHGGGDLNPISPAEQHLVVVPSPGKAPNRDATRLQVARYSRVCRPPSRLGHLDFSSPCPKLWLGLAALMVVRDKLENPGDRLAWRRLEQDQLPELPCLGPALAAADPHARAASSP
ncbi:hypothetical protein C2845_PM11G23440 [Panicum miliaceum]|uniref:Uncharacterized protein n=1 Tax=Panicum miliaceum TaxID=4540 RepID=A0A3L6RTS9_PANMI|nr:hypothetical protein C2845_PM11G23440 [Panicum miliaceum]